jgi:NAD(P)-dependent dehydrogenase (short-subunit alcohol dehydrogenase family)
MLLPNKNAIIYGGGAISGAVAAAFAREGAHVFLAGRNKAKLTAIAKDIEAEGGQIETAVLDALDEKAIDAHANAVAAKAGSIDIVFDLISYGDVQGTPLVEMELADFERPILTAVRTMFLTTRAAARHMIPQKSGVILIFGGEGDPMRDYYIGGFQVALHAVEAMRRQYSAELGQHGIRLVTLRTGGVPETISADMEGGEAIADSLTEATMLGRAATLADVGNVAAFVASDQAKTMTAATVNISSGALID